MNPLCTSQAVREFLLNHYHTKFTNLKVDLATIRPDFDLLTEGIIDSLGLLEMIAAVEERFGVSIDLEGLDAEQVTVLGPLCDYIEKTAATRSL